jgi:hypothetical protein
MNPNPGLYPPQPPPPLQKKSNVLIWILVAVGCLFLIGFAGIVGGGLYVAHRVKDFAETRDGKLVLKQDGKDVVISSGGKGANGSFEVKSADGTVKFGAGTDAKVPSWVPSYPGASNQGVFSAQTKEGASGSFTFKTSDSVSKVAEFYDDGLKSSGLKINSTVQSGQGTMIVAEDEDKKRAATVIIGSDNQTTVSVTYTAK